MWTPAKLVWTGVGVLLVLATSSTAPAQNIVFGSFNASLDTGSLAGTIFPVIPRRGLENVTDSFQVLLPPHSPVKNITFGFGDQVLLVRKLTAPA